VPCGAPIDSSTLEPGSGPPPGLAWRNVAKPPNCYDRGGMGVKKVPPPQDEDVGRLHRALPQHRDDGDLMARAKATSSGLCAERSVFLDGRFDGGVCSRGVKGGGPAHGSRGRSEC
jgi:hypothetical protein